MADAYPDADELKRFLYAAGMIDDPTSPTNEVSEDVVDYDRIITGVATDFERDIHRKILAATYTREYNPPTNRNSRLWTGDLLSVSAVTYADATIATTDYFLGPDNVLDLGLPYQYIDFFRRWQSPVSWANRRQLVVTGSFGYATTIPDAVTTALLAKAAADLFPAFATLNTGGGAMEQREGDLEEQYGINPGESLEKRFRALYTAAVDRYRCLTSGMAGTAW